jgi:hypothetical protein
VFSLAGPGEHPVLARLNHSPDAEPTSATTTSTTLDAPATGAGGGTPDAAASGRAAAVASIDAALAAGAGADFDDNVTDDDTNDSTDNGGAEANAGDDAAGSGESGAGGSAAEDGTAADPYAVPDDLDVDAILASVYADRAAPPSATPQPAPAPTAAKPTPAATTAAGTPAFAIDDATLQAMRHELGDTATDKFIAPLVKLVNDQAAKLAELTGKLNPIVERTAQAQQRAEATARQQVDTWFDGIKGGDAVFGKTANMSDAQFTQRIKVFKVARVIQEQTGVSDNVALAAAAKRLHAKLFANGTPATPAANGTPAKPGGGATRNTDPRHRARTPAGGSPPVRTEKGGNAAAAAYLNQQLKLSQL